MSSFSFSDLDMSNVKASGLPKLKEGVHNVGISSATIEAAKNSTNKFLKIRFDALNGSGYQELALFIFNPDPKKREYALSALKSLLIAANHPNPDKPNDVSSMVNHTTVLDIVVTRSQEDWVDDDGKSHASYEVAPFGSSFRRCVNKGDTSSENGNTVKQAEDDFYA